MYLGAVGVSSKDALDIPAGWPELIERQIEPRPQDSDQLDHRHSSHFHEPVALYTTALSTRVPWFFL